MSITEEMRQDLEIEYRTPRESKVYSRDELKDKLSEWLHHTPAEDEEWEDVYSLSMCPGEGGAMLQDIELTREEYGFLKHALAAALGLVPAVKVR